MRCCLGRNSSPWHCPDWKVCNIFYLWAGVSYLTTPSLNMDVILYTFQFLSFLVPDIFAGCLSVNPFLPKNIVVMGVGLLKISLLVKKLDSSLQISETTFLITVGNRFQLVYTFPSLSFLCGWHRLVSRCKVKSKKAIVVRLVVTIWADRTLFMYS